MPSSAEENIPAWLTIQNLGDGKANLHGLIPKTSLGETLEIKIYTDVISESVTIKSLSSTISVTFIAAYGKAKHIIPD